MCNTTTLLKMWRIAHSFSRGLRSARPSHCYSQDCSEDCNSTKYYHEISEVQAATLKHYSVASCWSPLTVKINYNSPGGIKCSLTQGVDVCHQSFSQVCEGIHTKSWDKGGTRGTERTVVARYQPKCPPWHWQILQDNKDLKENCSENEEKEEKQSRNGGENTCRFEEWKESLHASPTLHALGCGSAAALTWSLLYGYSEHHSSHYKKKKEFYLSQRNNNNKLTLKTVNNENNEKEEVLIYHKPYEYFYTSESRNDENCKKDFTKVNEDPQSKSNYRSTNVINSYKSQTQEVVIPIYSLQNSIFDKVKKWFGTQASTSTEQHKLEEIYKDEDHLEEPIFVDKCFSEREKIDSGCTTDPNGSFQSQPNSKKTDVPNEYNRSEENIDLKTVSDITSLSWDALQTSECLESTGEEHESDHSREHNQPLNNSNDDIKVLSDKLLKIVKAHHEERLSHLAGKDEKTMFDTNPEEMVVYLQAGVLMGDITSTFNLALCYHLGRGVSQDLEKARKLYEVASAAGHGWATYNLAVIVSQECEEPSLDPKVHSLLVQAAKLGVKEAEDALFALLEEEEQQYNVQHKDDVDDVDGIMRRCNSEPSMSSFLNTEFPSSYSTSDLNSLLDDDDDDDCYYYSSTTGDNSTVANVCLKV